MTVFLTASLIAAIVFGTLMAMRRGTLSRVLPIQAIQRLRERQPKKSADGAPSKRAGKFHAVTIELDPHPCAVVKSLDGKKLLSRDAPLLPLKECDQAACKCRFVHHDDRRSLMRRGYQSALSHIAAIGTNEDRRRRVGRRHVDVSGLE